MIRVTRANLSFFSTLKEEFLKFRAVTKYDLDAQLGDLTTGAKKFGSTLKGTDGETAETLEKAKRKKNKMMDALQAEWAKENARKVRVDAERADLPVLEKMRLQFSDLKEAMAKTTSQQAGVVALVQHCAAAHAAEVAEEVDVDVKSVNIVTEASSVTEGERVVGYIDAPGSTEEEVMVFAQKLQETCPAAKLHGRIEWVKAPEKRNDVATVGGDEHRRDETNDEYGLRREDGGGGGPPIPRTAMPRFVDGKLRSDATTGPGLTNSGGFTFNIPRKNTTIAAPSSPPSEATTAAAADNKAEWIAIQAEAQAIIDAAKAQGEIPLSYHKAVDKVLRGREEGLLAKVVVTPSTSTSTNNKKNVE